MDSGRFDGWFATIEYLAIHAKDSTAGRSHEYEHAWPRLEFPVQEIVLI